MKLDLGRAFALASLLTSVPLHTCAQGPPPALLTGTASAAAASGDTTSAKTSDEVIGPRVDAYVLARMRAEQIPGLALAVVRDGVVIKAKGYGLANIELNVAVTPETIFQSGSVGKQFTAAAVMMLVEEKKISLDDKLSKYIPGTPAKWKDVTIRELLTHTSGIADYGGEIDSQPTVINLRQDYTEDQLVKRFALLPMDFAPGTKWSYSNTGYVLLGIVIHKVTGEFYGDFLRERIFRPLGMNATRIISEADIVPNRAAGYELVNGEIKNQKWVSPTLNTTADGSLYTNVLDMAKWDAALYTDKLLTKASLQEMWTPVKLHPVNAGGQTSSAYGFGWDLNEVNGHRLIEHGGAWQGFTTHISRYTDDRLTVIVLCNLDADHAGPDRIAHHVAALYIPALTLAAAKTIEDKEPSVTALARATLADLAAGHANPERFADAERPAWTPERTEKLSAMLKALGALKSLALLERRDGAGGMRTYIYAAIFAANSADDPNSDGDGKIVTMALDASGKITAFSVREP